MEPDLVKLELKLLMKILMSVSVCTCVTEDCQPQKTCAIPAFGQCYEFFTLLVYKTLHYSINVRFSQAFSLLYPL